ncbi:MAG: 3-mercaptopyruvate sulfurtransferase [Phycisphaerae bacterium]|nr:3-mercaptopyruvate sulfurtransferase [Gemmatimonadaceae bacterium]
MPAPLVSTDWLASHLHEPWLKVVDASMYLPNAGRDARAEYLSGHIPGAVFADINWLSDENAAYPHTMPAADTFASRMGSLGLGSAHSIVVYDASGQNFSAPRLWWMLRVCGHHSVAVLDGGMKKWAAEDRAVDTAVPESVPAAFEAHVDHNRMRDIAFMRDNLSAGAAQVVDARSPGRFEATEPEPRAGVRGGHMPGSVNVHYASLVRGDGTLRDAAELSAIVNAAGLDMSRPIVASCGTGVTGCAVLLALDVIGTSNTALFDGSWTEWGSATDTPVETGPAR